MSGKQANENLEKVFGDVKELPMDMEKVKEHLSENVIVSTEKDDGTNDSTELIVGDGVVLYFSKSESTSKTSAGHAYKFTVEILHFGGSEMKGNKCNFRFTGANINMTIESENAEAVKSEMTSQLEDLGLSDSQKAVMADLIDGKTVSIKAGSDVWEMYSQVNEKVETTYDEELGTFWRTEKPRYDDMYDQYSYKVKDFSNRVKQRVYYKVDDSGTKWITENYEYTYLSDGSVKCHDVSYHEYTDQIWSEQEYIKFNDSTGKVIWQRSYRDDGTIEHQMYHNDDGNEVSIEYFSDGSIFEKRVVLPSENDSEHREVIYRETYGAPGVLSQKESLDGNIFTNEYYFPNGNLMERRIIDVTRHFGNSDEEPYIIEYINGFEDGSKTVFTFYDSGKQKTVKQYDADGNLNIETYYNENEIRISETYYNSDGKVCCDYHENGNLKTQTYYNADGEVYDVIHYDEYGNIIDN